MAAYARVKDKQSDKETEALAASLAPYYRHAFERIRLHEGKPTAMFNFAALLFGGLWYCYKGMWLRAVMILAAVFLSNGVLAFPLWLYGALYGTYDFYQYKVKDRSLWWVR